MSVVLLYPWFNLHLAQIKPLLRPGCKQVGPGLEHVYAPVCSSKLHIHKDSLPSRKHSTNPDTAVHSGVTFNGTNLPFPALLPQRKKKQNPPSRLVPSALPVISLHTTRHFWFYFPMKTTKVLRVKSASSVQVMYSLGWLKDGCGLSWHWPGLVKKMEQL